MKTRSAIISAIRQELTPLLASPAEESANETGMGNKEDKFLKNKAALDNTPGVEDLTTTALTGDGGMVLFEYSPFGVIGFRRAEHQPDGNHHQQQHQHAGGGQQRLLQPASGSEKVSLKLISLIEEIVFRCCGIRNLVVTVAEPTFEATQQMMAHPAHCGSGHHRRPGYCGNGHEER